MDVLQMNKVTILLSSPSDINKYIKNVKNAINKFNVECAETFGIYYVQRNWKDNTYPSYGEPPQTVINNQIVNNCDMVIALFGARMGTPTANHESGTIEEMEIIHNNNGKVMTYFFNGNTPMSDIDTKQLNEVRAFRSNFSGLYKEFNSGKDLEDEVFDNLKIIGEEFKNQSKGKLIISSLFDDELSDRLNFTVSNLFSVPLIKSLESNINTLIDRIRKNILPKHIPLDCKNDNSKKLIDLENIVLPNIIKPINFFKGTPIIFPNFIVDKICDYCKDHSVIINKEEFFFIGEATEINTRVTYDIKGTDNERAKVNDINELFLAIYKLTGCQSFIKRFENKYFLCLVISNVGNSFCEDIDLTLSFASENFDTLEDVSFSDAQSAKLLDNFAMDLLEPKGNTEIENMNYGKEKLPPYYPLGSVLSGRNEPDLDYYNNRLKCKLNNIYPYTIDNKNGLCSLKFDIGDLKQFTSAHVCGALVYDKPVKILKYVITTKSLSKQEKGTLVYNEDVQKR